MQTDAPTVAKAGKRGPIRATNSFISAPATRRLAFSTPRFSSAQSDVHLNAFRFAMVRGVEPTSRSTNNEKRKTPHDGRRSSRATQMKTAIAVARWGCVLAIPGLNRGRAAPRSGERMNAFWAQPNSAQLLCPMPPPPRLVRLTQPRDSHGDQAQAFASSRAPSPRAGEPARLSLRAPSRPRRASAGPVPKARTAVRVRGGGDRRAS